MGRLNSSALMFALAGAAAAVSESAGAQCRLCATPTTGSQESSEEGRIKIEIETSLNFDRLILFGQGEGTAIIRPDGARAVQGSIADIGPRAIVGTAVVHGQAGRAVRVELPARIELYSLGGSRISFDEVVSDLPTLPRLDSVGSLTFRFGGRVRVTGDSDGEYRGNLSITVEYQ